MTMINLNNGVSAFSLLVYEDNKCRDTIPILDCKRGDSIFEVLSLARKKGYSMKFHSING